MTVQNSPIQNSSYTKKLYQILKKKQLYTQQSQKTHKSVRKTIPLIEVLIDPETGKKNLVKTNPDDNRYYSTDKYYLNISNIQSLKAKIRETHRA